MSDERIERLTELARRVWPHLDEQKVIAETSGGAMITYTYLSPLSATTLDSPDEEERYVSYHTRIMQHPRALDALEAALLVLAEEVTLREVLERAKRAP